MRAVLVLAVVASGLALAGCHSCGVPQCALPNEEVMLTVSTSPAMALTGVQATLTGPVTVTMDCQTRASETFCTWPLDLVVTAGTYSLQVSAPGHEATTVPAQVTQGPGDCGCEEASLKPSIVVLGPADAGVD